MRRHALDLAVLLALGTTATVFVVVTVPGDRRLALHLYLLYVGSLLLFLVVNGVRAALPRLRRSELQRALDTRPEPRPPVPQLAKVEREVTLAIGNAHDFHARLAPQLLEIATARLERSGRRPGPETLGPWWDLLRPDRPPPEDRFAPGIREADLSALVLDLERL